jgi:hypothetical protein
MIATIQDTALNRIPKKPVFPLMIIYSTPVNIRSMAIAAMENRNIIR